MYLLIGRKQKRTGAGTYIYTNEVVAVFDSREKLLTYVESVTIFPGGYTKDSLLSGSHSYSVVPRNPKPLE